MNILGIDTATETLALCLKKGDGRISLFSTNVGFQHASRLLDAIEYLLSGSDCAIDEIDLIACSIGPGSFTGLRIGLATAKGLAAGRQCPLVGISTLEALAHPFCFSESLVVPVIDARKNQVYAALFQKGKRISSDLDIAPALLAEKLYGYAHVLLTGPMAHDFYQTCLNIPGMDVSLDPQCEVIKSYALVELGLKYYTEHGAAPAALCPVYIRRSDAELKSV